jgi:hypothetical protein
MPASDGLTDLLAGIFGARRQGKTTLALLLLATLAPPRLIVFDPMDEYGELAQKVRSLAELHAGILAGGRRYALRYVPPIRTDEDMAALPARFDAFCAIAADVGDLVMVVDELHLVTRPSWAPPAWRRCLTLGGHLGVGVVAVSHRPAQVDKVFFSLCNRVSTCRLNYDEDIATLAGILRAPREEVGALLPYQCITRNMVTGEVHRGSTRDAPHGVRPAARSSARRGARRRAIAAE